MGKQAIVVNLFGQPGAGKSTGAAYIFSQLKMAGVNCELITEYAKDLTWEHRNTALSCQEYVFGKQSYRMYRCRDQVDVIITDSPLLLSIFYNQNPVLEKHFTDAVMDVFNDYTNYNFLITRTKPYNPVGRNQTEEEATQIGKKIEDFLYNKGIIYLNYTGEQKSYDEIVKLILDALKDRE